jgi:outer membrane protein OmpA-like peptidoglycan-associated protein
MKTAGIFVLLFAAGAWAQTPEGRPDTVPIYKVTVVSRTLSAVNYAHGAGPTRIDFQGTVLMGNAKGGATVESKNGRVSIEANFDHLEAPTKFGTEYLTYVLWAITPDGRPKSLGEILVGPSNKAKLTVTTNLQAFGLMVTAEPYYSVSQPSDVVVLENVVRPDTMGAREAINVKYDLLPRGQYTYNVQAGQLRGYVPAGPSLPYNQYQAVLELYQAQNAVQIAQSLGAEQYAPDTIQKAESLLQRAQDAQARNMDTSYVISNAREAAQAAEDARTIAVRQRDTAQAAADRDARQQAEAQAQQASANAAAAQAQLDAQRDELERAKADAVRSQQLAAQTAAEAAALQARVAAANQAHQVEQADRVREVSSDESQRHLRAQLSGQLNAVMATIDTPRGLVISMPDSLFDQNANAPLPAATSMLARITSILSSYPGLSISVEGHLDNAGIEEHNHAVSEERARAVRDVLMSQGLTPGAINAVGYGSLRPTMSNATAEGRERNRRVEIVIAGQPIGRMATWDHPYPIH